jgi:hypothetical protein
MPRRWARQPLICRAQRERHIASTCVDKLTGVAGSLTLREAQLARFARVPLPEPVDRDADINATPRFGLPVGACQSARTEYEEEVTNSVTSADLL